MMRHISALKLELGPDSDNRPGINPTIEHEKTVVSVFGSLKNMYKERKNLSD
jgi:hypothetical protein